MIINLLILIGLTIAFGLIQKTADMISELQANNDAIVKNIDELRCNIGSLESKIKQSSAKKKAQKAQKVQKVQKVQKAQ